MNSLYLACDRRHKQQHGEEIAYMPSHTPKVYFMTGGSTMKLSYAFGVSTHQMSLYININVEDVSLAL